MPPRGSALRIQSRAYAWRRALGRIPVHLTLLLLCAMWITPVLGLLTTSFRPLSDVVDTGWWQILETRNVTLDNYRTAFDVANVGGAFLNSLLITIPANVGLVSVSAVAAYTLSKMRFVGRNTVFLGIIALLAIPPQVTLAPIFELFSALSLTGKIPSVWIFQAGFTMPLGIFILTAFFDELPDDLIEAAEVDGASPVQAFLRVVLPLAKPGLVSVLILHFIFSWNDLLIPLMLLRPDSAPLTVEIAGLMQQTSTDSSVILAAAAVVSVLLPMVLFYSLQRSFVRGLTSGAVKG